MKTVLATILSILIFIFELTTVLIITTRNTIKPETISEAIQKIDFIEIVETENNSSSSNRNDLKNKITSINNTIKDTFNNIGLTSSEANLLINTPTLKRIVGDFAGSVVLNNIDEETKIIYPKKEEIRSIASECYEIILKREKLDTTKEELIKIADENYDTIINELKKYADSISKEASQNE